MTHIRGVKLLKVQEAVFFMSTKTHNFVALYSGESVATARLICASADASLVNWVAQRLLMEEQAVDQDANVMAVQEGRRKALSLILGGKTS